MSQGVEQEERSESTSQLTCAQTESLSLPKCKNGMRERIYRSSWIIQSPRKRVMCIHEIRKSPAAGLRRDSGADTHHVDLRSVSDHVRYLNHESFSLQTTALYGGLLS